MNVVRLLPGDSLFVFDASAARVTVFGSSLPRQVHTTNLSTAGYAFPYWVEPLRDGRLIAAYRNAYGSVPARATHTKLKEFMRVLNADASISRDSVLTYPEYEAIPVILDGRERGELFNPFGRATLVALDGERVYTAWSGDWAVNVSSTTGRHLATIRPSIPPRPRRITRGELDSVVTAMSTGTFDRALIQRTMEAAGDRTWPLLESMLVDDDGYIWLALRGMRGEGFQWTAFDERGALVASVDLPVNVRIWKIHGNVAYGTRLDDDDVPHVVIYDLKPIHSDPARRA